MGRCKRSMEAMGLAIAANRACEVLLFLVEHRSDFLDSLLFRSPESSAPGQCGGLLGASGPGRGRLDPNASIRACACGRVSPVRRAADRASLPIPNDYSTSNTIHGSIDRYSG